MKKNASPQRAKEQTGKPRPENANMTAPPKNPNADGKQSTANKSGTGNTTHCLMRRVIGKLKISPDRRQTTRYVVKDLIALRSEMSWFARTRIWPTLIVNGQRR